MRLFDIANDPIIAEQIPTSIGVSAAPGSVAPVNPATQQAQKVGQQTLQQTDPATAALAAKEQQEKKKLIQDQITQLEKQLQDLRRQQAQLS